MPSIATGWTRGSAEVDRDDRAIAARAHRSLRRAPAQGPGGVVRGRDRIEAPARHELLWLARPAGTQGAHDPAVREEVTRRTPMRRP